MKKVISSVFVVILLLALTGCGTMGNFRANHVTNVELSDANFNIVARNVQGSAMQGFLFGVSAPQGSDVSTFALARVSGVERPFDTAS